MAHFAKIENQKVITVVVVDNKHEANGHEYLNGLGLVGTWVQTSYNANFGKKFAGIGDTYNESQDRFEPTSPFPSWVWNEESYAYHAPTPMPEGDHNWNEETLSWVAIEPEPAPE